VQAIFDDASADVLVASVSLTEFGRRLHALGASDAAVRQSLGDYRLLFSVVVNADEKVALAALDIGLATPARLPLVDGLIAAAAATSNASLVHRDEHLAAIPSRLVTQVQLPANEGV
jgi:predicted nucleic acid-binding protein